MSNGIVLSAAIRSNLLTLQNTAELQGKIQERLATGKKVNSALDNAANFFTAGSFNTRASDLSRLLDGMSNGIQTIKAATSGIESIKRLVDNLQATARQALQAPSPYSLRSSLQSSAILNANSSDLRGFSYAEATVTGTAIPNGATGATLLNDADINITAGESIVVNGQTITFVAAGAVGNNQANITDSLDTLLNKIDAITGNADQDSAVVGNALELHTGTANDVTLGNGTAGTLAKLGLSPGSTLRTTTVGPLDGDTMTVTVGSGPSAQQINITFGSTFRSLEDLNTALDGVGLNASLSIDGKITIQTTNETASQSFTVSGTAATTLFGAATLSSPVPTRGGPGALQRDSYVVDFNNLLSQIDKLAQDASFNGINLLNGDDLSVIFNETNTSTLEIRGVMFNSIGLSINPLVTSDFNDAAGIQSVLDKLENAHGLLRAQASKFGSNHNVVQMRQEFTKQMINTLNIGADNLTLADTNEEAANLLALNTRQQLAQNSLSLASQASQAVLRLFG